MDSCVGGIVVDSGVVFFFFFRFLFRFFLDSTVEAIVGSAITADSGVCKGVGIMS